MLIGLLLASSALGVAALLPPSLAVEWLGVILAIVAAIYVGFALVDARPRQVATELAFAGVTILLTLAGLWWQPWVLVPGYFLHGVWDMLHYWRRPIINTRLPWWYAFFCLTFDWPIAAYVLWRWV